MLRTPLLSSLAAAVLVGGAGLAVPALSQAREPNPRADAVRKVFPTAVRIQLAVHGELVRSASGIAFAVEGDHTFVLTNDHVVEPSKSWASPVELRVLPEDGRPAIAGKVVARGRVPDVDLAVVEVPGRLTVATLAPEDGLELGDDLVVVGAPFGKGLSVAAGIVSQVEYDFDESAHAPRHPKSIKTDAAIGYGSSGGGVFDVATGRLIGLVEGYRTARVAFGGKDDQQYAFDVPMPGETFVAPSAKIRRFLADNGLGRLAPATGRPGPAVATPSRL